MLLYGREILLSNTMDWDLQISLILCVWLQHMWIWSLVIYVRACCLTTCLCITMSQLIQQWIKHLVVYNSLLISTWVQERFLNCFNHLIVQRKFLPAWQKSWRKLSIIVHFYCLIEYASTTFKAGVPTREWIKTDRELSYHECILHTCF